METLFEDDDRPRGRTRLSTLVEGVVGVVKHPDAVAIMFTPPEAHVGVLQKPYPAHVLLAAIEQLYANVQG